MDYTVQKLNPGGGGKIYHTRLDRPQLSPSLLCNGYEIFFYQGLSSHAVQLTTHII